MFTIIIPCYNAAKTLHRALDSLCVQNHLIKEVLVIDDGSNDDPKSIVDAFVSRLPIIYHRQTNQGPSVARNFGLDKATGDYIVFLDADDALTTRILSEYENLFLKSHEVGMIIAGSQAIHPDKSTFKYPPVFRGPGMSELLDYWFGFLNFGIDSVAIRAPVVKSIRFPVNIRHGEDIVFFSHVLASTTVMSMSTIAVDVYHHADSLRHQHESFFREADTMVDLLFDPKVLPAYLLAYRNQYHAKRLASMAAKAAKLKQKDLAKAWLNRAIKLDYAIIFQPKTLKTWMRTLLD